MIAWTQRRRRPDPCYPIVPIFCIISDLLISLHHIQEKSTGKHKHHQSLQLELDKWFCLLLQSGTPPTTDPHQFSLAYTTRNLLPVRSDPEPYLSTFYWLLSVGLFQFGIVPNFLFPSLTNSLSWSRNIR